MGYYTYYKLVECSDKPSFMNALKLVLGDSFQPFEGMSKWYEHDEKITEAMIKIGC